MKKDLSYLETIKLIDETKKYFEKELERKLSLTRVQSPLFVSSSSGLQDYLNGVEKSVSFTKGQERFEIVHSLAKWKRDALGRYGFTTHTGLYTDMKAIRKDEIVDDIHSMFVEQYDWEMVINYSDRNIDFLKDTVNKIYQILRQTSLHLKRKYKFDSVSLPKSITFITSQELEDLYKEYSPKIREEVFAKEKKAIFIIGIGDKLKSGIPHDLRSPDYDDWSLDGDMIIYDEVLKKGVEITSMGIRVDEKTILSQLEKSKCMDRLSLPYHQKIIKKDLPYTIGGGIGISRILLLLLQKSHIAEIQSSSWEEKTLEIIKDKKIL
jgi:aspartate--ammonia ligase